MITQFINEKFCKFSSLIEIVVMAAAPSIPLCDITGAINALSSHTQMLMLTCSSHDGLQGWMMSLQQPAPHKGDKSHIIKYMNASGSDTCNNVTNCVS